MKEKNIFTKMLAIIGTILVWLPIFVPIFFSIVSIFSDRVFRFDYLMPAELFLLVLVGGFLLFWAGGRAHEKRGLIGWGLGLAVGLLVGSQALAVVTGLANGETQPGGWQWVLVLGMLAGYIFAVMAVGIGGVRLWRDIFKGPRLLL